MSAEQDTTTTTTETLTGQVKWFNAQNGYGFITSLDGSNQGTDLFVHHSGIVVDNQQYKQLVQGEYVEFHLSVVNNKTYAVNVKGIKGGPLMCESNPKFRFSRKENVKKVQEQEK
tara:strand:- start:290 stop:634 length:345 start_codon:yes stop_codon:yes gene_type:complete